MVTESFLGEAVLPAQHTTSTASASAVMTIGFIVISFWPPADRLRLVLLDGLTMTEVPDIGGSTRNAASVEFLSGTKSAKTRPIRVIVLVDVFCGGARIPVRGLMF